MEYPYFPKGRQLLFVPVSNPFMGLAEDMVKKTETAFPWAKWITASVIAKDNKIIASKINNNVHFSFCPRRVFDSPSGQDYELCPRHCDPKNHSEARAIGETIEKERKIQGADLYMYGHWWCCKPCWDGMMQAGITNVFLVEGAEEKFSYEPDKRKGESPKAFSYYSAGPLTRLKNRDTRKMYDDIALLLKKINIIGYLPHRFTDPIDHPCGTPQSVYKKNEEKIRESDFVLAYIGEASLGVGIEIEIAQRFGIPVIGYARKNAKVSRMALGNPALHTVIRFSTIKELIAKLSEALEDIELQKATPKSKRTLENLGL